MRNQSKLIWYGFAAIAIVYCGVAFTPAKSHIGRHSPALASLFSPVFFNFSHNYHSGNVLEFHVGMARVEFLRSFKANYAGRASLIENCKVTTAASIIPVQVDLDIGSAYGGGDTFCAAFDSRMSGVIVHFKDDKVEMIRVSFVRTEGW